MSFFQTDLRRLALDFPRATGVFLILVGLAVGYFTVWVPFSEMQAGVQSVRFQKANILLSVALPVIGTFYVVFGRPVVEKMMRQPEWTLSYSLLMLIFVAVIIGSFLAIDRYISSLGYESRPLWQQGTPAQ